MNRPDLLSKVSAEVDRARSLYPRFNSLHEGYAVMLEEVEELWEMIRKSKELNADDRMRDEAIQIAAMAIRFIEDLYES
jgi:hypothetical protein